MISTIVMMAVLGLADLPATDAAGEEFFEKKIRPILIERCQSCHGEQKQKGDLRLDSRAGLLTGGKGGPAVVPGKTDESPLIEAILYEDATKMPPKSKLPATEIADLARWVEMGAPWPAEARKSAGAAPKSQAFNLKERAKHWSFQPVRRVEPPEVKLANWPLSAIDRFLLADLEAKGLTPAPDADRRTLIRRLSFDLTGLPPAQDEVDAFLKDETPTAYEKLVDRLLASPCYGERWARHWLDLVRYAETSGHEFDYDIPDAWRYRDYVVRAMNLDLPYNQFVTEQVAGDLIAKPRRNPADGSNESILGTGIYFLGESTHSPVDVREDEIMRVDNQIDVLSKTFLGLTVSCARCHDHKFDAISTKDYYSLTGFLRSSRFDHAAIDAPDRIDSKVIELKRLQAEMVGLVDSSEATRQALTYFVAAKEILAGKDDTTGDDPKDVVFQDFEGPDYGGWTTTGAAFGDSPIRLPLPSYQGEVGAKGQGLVGSHNGRFSGNVVERDNLTGTLTSPGFTIDRGYIHFLIGGGSYPGKTCVNLSVDGKVVATATGHDQNLMQPYVFDVRAHRDKMGKLEVVDHQMGHWGNISLDHVVFSDHAFPDRDPRRFSIALAKRHGLDPTVLARWVEALPRWKIVSRNQSDSSKAAIFADFDTFPYRDWTASGVAFGAGPSGAGSVRVGPGGVVPVTPGMAHSGLISDQLQGTLRSRTFVITKPYLHALALGSKGQVRVVVDGFEKIRDPIYGGLIADVNSNSARWHTINLGMWVGQKAYIEIADGAALDYRTGTTRYAPGDGFIAIDEIWFSDEPAMPTTESRDKLPTAKEITNAFQSWRCGKNSGMSTAVLDWLARSGLVTNPPGVTPMLARYREMERTIPAPTMAPTICDGTGEDEPVLMRGSAKMPGELAPRRFLEAIVDSAVSSPFAGSGRMELARRMLDPSCPFPARVMVNRLWKHHFGVGLVRTPDDFGVMGEPPSHPELLDWLATEFVAKGWSLKAMHREMVLSRAYRMASKLEPEAEVIDPSNRLLHRMNVKRLEAEAIRDAMLSVSGRLDGKMGGPGVLPALTPFMEGRGRPGESGPLDGDGRRSLYLNIRRNFLSPMLLAFDFPAPASTMGRRNISNVPAQALTLLNDPFVLGQARRWAERLLKQPGRTTEARLIEAYEGAFGRPPDPAEIAEAKEFMAGRTAEADELTAWSDFCHVLFNVKEFLFVP